MTTMEPLSMGELGTALDDVEHPKKLAILGLPWDTTEDALREYFSKFGELEQAEVMKDRYTGKSRGFGFVTFHETSAATVALAAEHSIDGRRCEAKAALPKGETSIPRTTRIFVARIPPSVTEVQFRGYFESFGKLQDDYMPRDHSKQGYRGIGFVTFTSPDSVEKVMAIKHWMNGHEIAIDRATPKEENSNLQGMFKRPLSNDQRRSFDNGAGIIGPGLTSIMHVFPGGVDSSYSQLRAISEESDLNGVPSGVPSRTSLDHVSRSSLDQVSRSSLDHVNRASLDHVSRASLDHVSRSSLDHVTVYGNHGDQSAMASRLAMNMNLQNSASAAASSLQNFVKNSNPGQCSLSDMSYNSMQSLGSNPGLHNMSAAEIQASILSNGAAGPRIFIGKLTKETSEADVKEYFMKFGYVMDVYMPKSKDNKAEHRGFGFVTFETEAAIQRVVEEDILVEDGMEQNNAGHFSNQLGMAPLGMMQQRL
eukprot:gene894-5690_t